MTKPLLGNEALHSGQKSKNMQSVAVLSICGMYVECPTYFKLVAPG